MGALYGVEYTYSKYTKNVSILEHVVQILRSLKAKVEVWGPSLDERWGTAPQQIRHGGSRLHRHLSATGTATPRPWSVCVHCAHEITYAQNNALFLVLIMSGNPFRTSLHQKQVPTASSPHYSFIDHCDIKSFGVSGLDTSESGIQFLLILNPPDYKIQE